MNYLSYTFSICLSVHPYMSVQPSIYPSIYLYVYPSICTSVICLSIHPSVCPTLLHWAAEVCSTHVVLNTLLLTTCIWSKMHCWGMQPTCCVEHSVVGYMYMIKAALLRFKTSLVTILFALVFNALKISKLRKNTNHFKNEKLSKFCYVTVVLAYTANCSHKLFIL